MVFVYNVVAKDLMDKYGVGHIYDETCPLCGYKKYFFSSGVRTSDSGSMRVYAKMTLLFVLNVL